MSDAAAARQFGEGPLSRIAAVVYTGLVVEALFLVTALPGLVVLTLLDRDASNIPLAAACAVPVGPALSAAVFALHHRRGDLTELTPARAFWHGYRINVGGVLRIWVPWLAGLTLVGVNLGNWRASGVPAWWAALLVVIAVVATLWMADALVITSLYAFRARDVARLAGYFLGRSRKATLANLCLLVVAVAVTVVASELVLTLLAVPFVAVLLLGCRPVIAEVRREFTA